ncbi:hypothetical protein Scep_012017 [Stephania cephalantha]|uniref:Uncharacterized protein n=1 Tax=Stephania cephalantha TaxID=152367 RepID=A0AAP0P729_9MAGN
MMMDRMCNIRGRAFKIRKLAHQKWQSIIVPEGLRGGGWEDWLVAIDQMCSNMNAIRPPQPLPMNPPGTKGAKATTSRILSDQQMVTQTIRTLREWDLCPDHLSTVH